MPENHDKKIKLAVEDLLFLSGLYLIYGYSGHVQKAEKQENIKNEIGGQK